MKPRSTALLLTFLLFVAGACGSARRSEPLRGALPIDDTELALGQRSFDANCSQCHPGGEGGLGPAINNKPLPGFLIRFQVRNGLGAMPAFGEREIPDRELDAMVKYLHTLRRHD